MDICKTLKTVRKNLSKFKNYPFTIKKDDKKLISWNSEPEEPADVYKRILKLVDLVSNETGEEDFYEYSVTYTVITRRFSMDTSRYELERHLEEFEINFPISNVDDDPSNIYLCFKTKTLSNPDGLPGYDFFNYPSGGYKKS